MAKAGRTHQVLVVMGSKEPSQCGSREELARPPTPSLLEGAGLVTVREPCWRGEEVSVSAPTRKLDAASA